MHIVILSFNFHDHFSIHYHAGTLYFYLNYNGSTRVEYEIMNQIDDETHIDDETETRVRNAFV